MKKEFIKEHIREAIIGIGASIVIVGAWLKITNYGWGPINGDNFLTLGLVTEAIIFAIIGFEAYVGGSSKSEEDDLKTNNGKTK